MTVSPLPRVLLVEDDADCAEELAELLDCFGCRVTVAGSVAQARAAMSEPGIGLAVVDLGLPDASGLELARDWMGRQDVRIVLLSGRTMTPAERASFGGDPPALLLKPASGAQILQALGLPASD